MYQFRIESLGDGRARCSGPCVVTGRHYEVIVEEYGLLRWLRGECCIQDALPGVPKEEREFLISGTSPDGWAETFGGDDEAFAAFAGLGDDDD